MGDGAEKVELPAPEQPLGAVDSHAAVLAAPLEAVAGAGPGQVGGDVRRAAGPRDRKRRVVGQACEPGDVDARESDEARVLGEPGNAQFSCNVASGVLVEDLAPQPVEAGPNLEQLEWRERVGERGGKVLAAVQCEAAESGHVAVGERIEAARVAEVVAREEPACRAEVLVQPSHHLVDEPVAERRGNVVLHGIVAVRFGPVACNRPPGLTLPGEGNAVARERRSSERVDHGTPERREFARALVDRRNRRGAGGRVPDPCAFESAEEETSLKRERPAEGASELVSAIRRERPVGGIEVVSRIQCVIACVFVGRAVELLGAESAHDVYLSAGAATVLGAVSGGVQPELQHSVKRRADDEPIDVEVVVVDPVQEEVVGDLPSPRDMESAVILGRELRTRRARMCAAGE